MNEITDTEREAGLVKADGLYRAMQSLRNEMEGEASLCVHLVNGGILEDARESAERYMDKLLQWTELYERYAALRATVRGE